jgi:D-alanyl-D-alanine dipeptidase
MLPKLLLYCSMLSTPALMLTAALLSGCRQTLAPAPPAPAPASVNTEPLPIAANAAAETLLVDVRSADSTIRVDARYATPNNFTGKPLPGYQASKALLRREAARALARVQARLRPRGLGLVVFDGYRPVRATLAMVQWAKRTGQESLLQQGYIARRSRHNLGLAVDLSLVALDTGVPLDMGTPFDTFSESAHTANAEGQIRRNRETLVRAMEAEGFSNYDQEWWHFTFPVEGAQPFDMVIQ